MEDEKVQLGSAQDAEQKKIKTREVEVQFTVKWVNFTFTVEAAKSGVDAVDQALASYEASGLDEFVITAGNEECSNLDEIFRVAQDFTKAIDENGNDVVGWDEWDDDDEDEELTAGK
jgi:translation elongation factor EF-1beta